jgi:hypothetical protein
MKSWDSPSRFYFASDIEAGKPRMLLSPTPHVPAESPMKAGASEKVGLHFWASSHYGAVRSKGALNRTLTLSERGAI